MKALAGSVLFISVFSVSCGSVRWKSREAIEQALRDKNLSQPSEIALQRVYSGCFNCPDHRIDLIREKGDQFADAKVTYTDLHSKEERQGKLAPYYYNVLLDVIESQKYFEMRDEYAMNWFDATHVNTSVKIGERNKSIRTSNEGEVPLQLKIIYLAFDGVTAHVIWDDGKASNATGVPGY